EPVVGERDVVYARLLDEHAEEQRSVYDRGELGGTSCEPSGERGPVCGDHLRPGAGYVELGWSDDPYPERIERQRLYGGGICGNGGSLQGHRYGERCLHASAVCDDGSERSPAPASS